MVANLYDVLGLKQDATTDEIRRAYRRLARQHHPDITGHSDAVRFREIKLAYETLSDAVSRASYDRTLESRIRIPVRILPSRKGAAYAEPLIPPRRAVDSFDRRSPFIEQEAFEEIFHFMEGLLFRF